MKRQTQADRTCSLVADEPHVFKRHVRLVVLQHPYFEPFDTVPSTRAHCPQERPCPHVRCRYSLLREDEPPGRPSLRDVPRDDRGWTRSVKGDLAGGAGNPPALDGRAPWLHEVPSCALDVAEAGAHGNTELGAALGKHRTLAARLVRRALVAFRDAGGTIEGLQLLAGEIESRTTNLGQAIELLSDRATPNIRRERPATSESTPEPKAEEQVLTNEAVRALIEVGYSYFRAGRPFPEHLTCDLRDAAWCDSIALPLREQARRLLEVSA